MLAAAAGGAQKAAHTAGSRLTSIGVLCARRSWAQAAPRHRSCCALQAATLEKAATFSTSQEWYTQAEHFTSIEQSTHSEQLEDGFWHHPVFEVPADRDEAEVLMERLQHDAATLGTAAGVNVVAFTGGNGPALTAYLLTSAVDGAVVACVGDVTKLPQEQVKHAVYVADLLGIDLVEVDAAIWRRFQVPLALTTDVDELCGDLADATCQEAGMVLFTGATCDDISSYSREGRILQGIKAPLAGISRAAVNVLSKAVGLPQRSGSNDDPAANTNQVALAG